MDSILITGGSGFLGGNLALMAPSSWKTYLTYNSNSIRHKKTALACNLDITNYNAVERLINEIAPKIIFHLAAITNSSFCEEKQKTAREVNVIGTENIVKAAEQVHARLIYISSDLIFRGDDSFYTEESYADPICYYGKTKLEGEKIVASFSSDYCIARTSLIYGWSSNSSKCFTEIMISNMRKGNEITLFKDEYRTPIYIKNVCAVLIDVAKNNQKQTLYHICGPERLSRYEFGLKVSKVFALDKELIVPTSSATAFLNCRRPKDCSMSNEKAINDLKADYWSIEKGLKDMRKRESESNLY